MWYGGVDRRPSLNRDTYQGDDYDVRVEPSGARGRWIVLLSDGSMIKTGGALSSKKQAQAEAQLFFTRPKEYVRVVLPPVPHAGTPEEVSYIHRSRTAEVKARRDQARARTRLNKKRGASTVRSGRADLRRAIRRDL